MTTNKFMGSLFILLLLIAITVYAVAEGHISTLVGLPMLAMGAVLLMLGSLAGISLLYISSGVHDPKQALALPEGSIRAVIALVLIVLFAILCFYLFGTISAGTLVQIGEVNGATKAALEQIYRGGELKVVAVPGDKFLVWLQQEPTTASVGFAKETLVLVGTLVTSISSFYFGARVATESSKGEGPAASLSTVAPNIGRANDAEQEFTVKGSSLSQMTTVTLVNNKAEIGTEIIKVAADSITFKAKLPTSSAGKWDVVATGPEGKRAELKGALTVTA